MKLACSKLSLLFSASAILAALTFMGCGGSSKNAEEAKTTPIDEARDTFARYSSALKQKEWKTAYDMLCPALQKTWLTELEFAAMNLEDIDRKKSPDLLYIFKKHGIEDLTMRSVKEPKDRLQYLVDLADYITDRSKEFSSFQSNPPHLLANPAGRMEFKESSGETVVNATYIDPFQPGVTTEINGKKVTEQKLPVKFVKKERAGLLISAYQTHLAHLRPNSSYKGLLLQKQHKLISFIHSNQTATRNGTEEFRSGNDRSRNRMPFEGLK